jgi:hypothetical protein
MGKGKKRRSTNEAKRKNELCVRCLMKSIFGKLSFKLRIDLARFIGEIALNRIEIAVALTTQNENPLVGIGSYTNIITLYSFDQWNHQRPSFD